VVTCTLTEVEFVVEPPVVTVLAGWVTVFVSVVTGAVVVVVLVELVLMVVVVVGGSPPVEVALGPASWEAALDAAWVTWETTLLTELEPHALIPAASRKPAASTSAHTGNRRLAPDLTRA